MAQNEAKNEVLIGGIIFLFSFSGRALFLFVSAPIVFARPEIAAENKRRQIISATKNKKKKNRRRIKIESAAVCFCFGRRLSFVSASNFCRPLISYAIEKSAIILSRAILLFSFALASAFGPLKIMLAAYIIIFGYFFYFGVSLF